MLSNKIALAAPPSHFQRPAKVIVSGPSMSGKTTIVRYILDNNLITPPPKFVYWISESAVPDKNPNYNYIHSAIPEDDFLENLYDAAVVLDDCQASARDSDMVSKLFRRLSHHNQLIVFLIVQNLSFSGKCALDTRRNCDYYILFKNPADADQYRRFQSKFELTKNDISLNRMIQHITKSNPHFCLIVDLRFSTPEVVRYRIDPRRTVNGRPPLQGFIAVRGRHKAELSRTSGTLHTANTNRQSSNTVLE